MTTDVVGRRDLQRASAIIVRMHKARVLVVDDEDLIRWSLVERLAQEGYELVEAATGKDGLARCDEGVDLILLDYKLPDIDGLTILKQVRQAHPDTLVILLTAYSTIDSAVEAIKLGAYHYLSKPFDIEEVLFLVDKALETTQLRREVGRLRDKEARPYQLDRIIGDSAAMQEVKALLQKIAASPTSTVLLTGESGTGKDLAAKVIHYTGDRAGGPFMNITCSALADTLFESELFGHERGAFTDARQMRRGLLESADHGTVFLDEISEMPPPLQAKLLRFLEEKTFKRLGGLGRHHGRRADHRGDEPQSRRRRQARQVPRRSVLPFERPAGSPADPARAIE